MNPCFLVTRGMRDQSRPSGAAVLTLVFVLGVVSVLIVAGVVFALQQQLAQERAARNAERALVAAESGAEEVMLRVMRGETVPSPLTLAVGAGTATVTNSVAGQVTTITSRGDVSQTTRAVEVSLLRTTTNVSFNYGVQVDVGGLSMGNNAIVNGNIYSNGSIVGNNGARITGDAFVAIGTPAEPNQQWTAQNADVNVGVTTGSAVRVLDSSGNVGEYASLAIGPDGFPRISYIYGTGDDLKFAQCNDDDCSAPALTTVDSTTQNDEVTSVVIAADGFARISYYNDAQDDLKFARCTNADCSSRIITTVDSANNTGDFSAIAMGPDDLPRIAYWYDTGEDVRFVRCLNADCTSRNITNVETAGDVGEYIDLAMGADGFARMSYFSDSDDDLKFVRCTNDDCATRVITTVDSAGNVGKYTSISVGADTFARIAYYDDSNDNLKFIRCLNADCTLRNTATVDATGDVGKYTSLALGPDGFARISYFQDSGDDLKYARCNDADCGSVTVSVVDTTGSVGKYTAIGIAPDGFARIAYYDDTSDNLKYVRCVSDACPAANAQVDVGQSLRPSITDRVVRTELFLKKVGNPANATLRLIRDSGGSPSTNGGDVLTTGTVIASQVTASYGWLNVAFTSTPTLNANTTYWLVIDTVSDNDNYFVWGADAAQGYGSGTAKSSTDWQAGGWTDLNVDTNFRVFMGGVDYEINNVDVDGSANAHIVEALDVGGNVNAFSFNNGAVGGNVHADTISNCTVGGNAEYNTRTNCTVGGGTTTPTTSPDDPPYASLPISEATIAQWKNDAQAGGTCAEPTCDINGNYLLTNGASDSIGPLYVPGNLTIDNNATLTITGTIWVQGNVTLSNNCTVRLDVSYGSLSGVLLNDGVAVISNNCIFSGSGAPGSYVMLLTDRNAPLDEVMTVDNNSVGVIFYARRGRINLSNNAVASEVTGYGITMDNNATIAYESGLANAQFSSGPGGGYAITGWREVVP